MNLTDSVRYKDGDNDMATCRCTSLKHPEHLDRVCENLATESDGYCKICHDRAGQEWAQRQPNPPPAGNPPGR
jgi:hypothetical protein